MPESAIDHTQAAVDVERVNRLILLNAGKAVAAGRIETVRHWLEWFENRDMLEQDPAVAVLGAFYTDDAASERWADAAEHPSPALLPDGSARAQRGSPERILPDGSTLASWQALLRGRTVSERYRCDAS